MCAHCKECEKEETEEEKGQFQNTNAVSFDPIIHELSSWNLGELDLIFYMECFENHETAV